MTMRVLSWRPLSVAIVVEAALATCAAAEAGGDSVRERMKEQLRAEFQYAAPAPRPAGEKVEADVVELPPFITAAPKDRTPEVVRYFRDERARELQRRPHVERGASIDLPRATIGPRPYEDLLKEDARFKSHQKVTPTWNLLDIKL